MHTPMWRTTFGLLIIVGVTVGTMAFNGNNSGAVNNGPVQKQLQLVTSIAKKRYCSGQGSRFLEWTLNLKYTNLGLESILLDKRSSRVSRNLVSTDLKALSSQRYVYAPIPVHADLDSLGYRPTPDPDSFVILKPSESLTLESHSRVAIHDGPTGPKNDLPPGNYILQVRVPTWYYYADPKTYREQWINKGYLWAEVVTSDPMAFTIEKQPKVAPCLQ